MRKLFVFFINYLCTRNSSHFKRLNTVFARNKYQSSKVNLSHSHMQVQLGFESMLEEKKKVNKLKRASNFDIVKQEEISRFL